MPGHTKCCTCQRKIILANHSKPTDLMLQNATPLRKSAPWPPNISHERVFCIAPATENASLQILFKCPTPASVFWKSAENPHVLLTFETVHNPLRLPRETRSECPKVVRTWCVFVHFDFDMCFAPQPRALFQHLNFQKSSEHGVFCTFWLRNVLRATTACTFSTWQLPKVVWTWGAFSFFTYKCASHHNGVHFFIWPDGSAPAALASLLFDPPEPQIIGKTQCFATFLPFRAPVSSYFWLFLFSDLLSSALLFSLPLPISAFHLSMLSEVWLLNLIP